MTPYDFWRCFAPQISKSAYESLNLALYETLFLQSVPGIVAFTKWRTRVGKHKRPRRQMHAEPRWLNRALYFGEFSGSDKVIEEKKISGSIFLYMKSTIFRYEQSLHRGFLATREVPSFWGLCLLSPPSELQIGQNRTGQKFSSMLSAVENKQNSQSNFPIWASSNNLQCVSGI